MKHPEIAQLLGELHARYAEAVIPYGTSDAEEDGTGFRIEGIPATFSAILPAGIRPGRYDIQIESFPPGAYIYQDEVDLAEFLRLVEEYRRPAAEWRPERWKNA